MRTVTFSTISPPFACLDCVSLFEGIPSGNNPQVANPIGWVLQSRIETGERTLVGCPIEPLNDYVVAVDDRREQTVNNLVIPLDVPSNPLTAVVAAIGDKVTSVKDGDRIFYRPGTATTVAFGNARYLMVKSFDIIARVREDSET